MTSESKARKYRHNQLRIPDAADLPRYSAVWKGLYNVYIARTLSYGSDLADKDTGLIMARGWSIERHRRARLEVEVARLTQELAEARDNG